MLLILPQALNVANLNIVPTSYTGPGIQLRPMNSGSLRVLGTHGSTDRHALDQAKRIQLAFSDQIPNPSRCIAVVATTNSKWNRNQSKQSCFRLFMNCFTTLSNIEVQSMKICCWSLPNTPENLGDISLRHSAPCFHFHSRPNCCKKKSCCSCRVIT